MRPQVTFQTANVLSELALAGITTQRETINFVSDHVLGFQTRTTETAKRRWTRAQVDDLVTAFVLGRIRGLSWDEVAAVMRGESPAAVEDVDAHLERLAKEVVALHEEIHMYERLASRLKALRPADDQGRLPLAASA